MTDAQIVHNQWKDTTMGYNTEYTNDLDDMLREALHSFVPPSPKVVDKADLLIEKSNENFSANWAVKSTTVKFGFDRNDWSHVIRGIKHPNTGKVWLLELDSSDASGEPVKNRKGFDIYQLVAVSVMKDEYEARKVCQQIRTVIRLQREEWAEAQLAELDDNEHSFAADVYGNEDEVAAEEALDEMEALMGASVESEGLTDGFHVE